VKLPDRFYNRYCRAMTGNYYLFMVHRDRSMIT